MAHAGGAIGAAPKHEDILVDSDGVELGKQLGSGGFGVVYKAKYKGSPVAVKLINFKVAPAVLEANPDLLANLTNEIQILMCAHHIAPKHALSVKGWGLAPGSDGNVCGFVILSLMEGDLSDRRLVTAPLKTRLGVLRHIAVGMRKMHQASDGGQIIHADLKPANVLFRVVGGELDIRIADFGMAKVRARVATGSVETLTPSKCGGTPVYMAPEILVSRVAKTTAKTDVYAWAIMAWELLSGRRAYVDSYLGVGNFIDWLKEEVYSRRRRPDLRELHGVPSALSAIISKAWEHSPDARPSFDEIATVLRDAAPSPVPADLGDGTRKAVKELVGASGTLAPAGGASSLSPPSTAAPARVDTTAASKALEKLKLSTTVIPSPSSAADEDDISNVDVLILMDLTGSMGSWLAAAKTRAREIVARIRSDDAAGKVRVGFVGYRDYDVKEDGRVVASVIASDLGRYESVVAKEEAYGGGDGPEDVAAGLRMAVRPSIGWKSQTKVLVHFLDAPPHGAAYHDESWHDTYPDGDPKGSRIEDLVAEVARQHIDYILVQVNGTAASLAKATGVMTTAYNAASTGRKMEVRSLSDDAKGLADLVAKAAITSRAITKAKSRAAHMHVPAAAAAPPAARGLAPIAEVSESGASEATGDASAAAFADVADSVVMVRARLDLPPGVGLPGFTLRAEAALVPTSDLGEAPAERFMRSSRMAALRATSTHTTIRLPVDPTDKPLVSSAALATASSSAGGGAASGSLLSLATTMMSKK